MKKLYTGSLAEQLMKGVSSIVIFLSRSARHNSGHCAAEADQHGYDAASREPYLAQELIHYKSDSSHIAAVLQQRQEEKQSDYDRQKAENAAYAGEYAVYDERVQRFVYIPCGESGVCRVGQP